MDLSPHEEDSTKRDHDLGSLASSVTDPRAGFQTPKCMPRTHGTSGPWEGITTLSAIVFRNNQRAEFRRLEIAAAVRWCSKPWSRSLSHKLTEYRGSVVRPSYSKPLRALQKPRQRTHCLGFPGPFTKGSDTAPNTN